MMKKSVKMSLLSNLLLIRLCKSEKLVEELPNILKLTLIAQCFTQGVDARKTPKTLDELEDSWKELFSSLNFAWSERYKYDYNL